MIQRADEKLSSASSLWPAHDQLRVFSGFRGQFVESRRFGRSSGRPVSRRNILDGPGAMLRVREAPRYRPDDRSKCLFLPVRFCTARSTPVPKNCRSLRHAVPVNRPKSLPKHRSRQLGLLFPTGEYFDRNFESLDVECKRAPLSLDGFFVMTFIVFF